MAAEPPEPKFRAVTIDDQIQIGYGLAVADVDGDGKPDVLLADKKQFVWYRNPGADKAGESSAWKKYLIAENLTEKDNVCLAAQDIDGDGKCEVAVGAEWNPADTEKSGAVFYLIAPADRTQKWEAVKFPSVEPTTHRMKWLKLDDGTWGLLVVPLHGRGNKNAEGAPVKVLLYRKPADPHREWKSEVIDESMHAAHNFHIASQTAALPQGIGLIIGGKEGLRGASAGPNAGQWSARNLLPADGGREATAGVGEVRTGGLPGKAGLIATVEPMHGNMLAVYTNSARDIGNASSERKRHVLTDQLTEGHALACGDVLKAGYDQVIVGWRGNPQKVHPVGIKLFTPLDQQGEKWRESFIDDDGMGCEDLVLADLNGDEKLDVVASGRSTRNVKVYLNETAN